MRVVWTLLLTAAGCGFSPNPAANQTGDDANPTPTPDAPVTKVWDDAPKLPPDACIDSDNDGVCDAVDDWACGAKPTTDVPPATVQIQMGMIDYTLGTSATKIQINSQTSLISVTKQQALRIQFAWKGTDMTCGQECIDQLEVGFHVRGSATAGHRSACLIDQAIPKPNGSTGTVDNSSVTAPNTAGVYELRAGIAEDTGCTDNGSNDYYSGEPATVMALFCVQ